MEEKILFELENVYRDPMRIRGFSFGEGEKSVCIVGATRGNEIQQMYICSQLVRILSGLEEQGQIEAGRSVMVIPTVNSHSMNIGKRFWPTDNTDINRTFPGYSRGETTQRIAAGIFENIQGFACGIQLASFYMQGSFIPHVRMMKTGWEDAEAAKDFALPYVFLREPRPYDTTTLNYNWQVWETRAYSVYTNATDRIDRVSAAEAVTAILRFLNRNGIIKTQYGDGAVTQIIDADSLVSVKSGAAGLFVRHVEVQSLVQKGALLAEIMDPFSGKNLDRILAPEDGIVFFHADQPAIYSQTVLFRIIPDRWI